MNVKGIRMSERRVLEHLVIEKTSSLEHALLFVVIYKASQAR